MTTPQDWLALQRDLATFRDVLGQLRDTAMERTDNDGEAFYDGQTMAYEQAVDMFDSKLARWVNAS